MGEKECWISRTSLYFWFWHTFPDRKPMFSPRKYQMTLISSVYETLPVMMPGSMQMGWKTLESFIQTRTGEMESSFRTRGVGEMPLGGTLASSLFTVYLLGVLNQNAVLALGVLSFGY